MVVLVFATQFILNFHKKKFVANIAIKILTQTMNENSL
jgi:hypothetical protein